MFIQFERLDGTKVAINNDFIVKMEPQGSGCTKLTIDQENQAGAPQTEVIKGDYQHICNQMPWYS